MLGLPPGGRRKAWVMPASEPAASVCVPLEAMSLKVPSRYGPSALPGWRKLPPVGENRPARKVVGPAENAIEPLGPSADSS